MKSPAAALAAVLFAATGCVSFPEAPPRAQQPAIEEGRLIARDGAALGLEIWRAEMPRAIVLAVHGMNDYAHAFELLGADLAARGVTVYAYDQRGFGRSPEFGRWPGAGALIADLHSAIAAVRADNPGLPLFVLGHSMGAGLVMAAAGDGPLDVDGAILAAPGVWGSGRLPIAYRIAANVGAAVSPARTLTGERAGRQSTDNIDILREMAADPLVIKETRLDAILGVVRLMGAAWRASDEIGGRVLFLYGEKDEIIPVKAMAKASQRLCGEVERRVYPESWHLVFRDLGAARVRADVADWLVSAAANAAGAKHGFGPAAHACSIAD